MYYRGAQAAIIVYDLTNASTFDRAKTWIKELQKQASPNIVMALVGNKMDLVSSATAPGKRGVSEDEARKYAEENGCIYFEASAKSGVNVFEIFKSIAEKLPKDIVKERPQGRLDLSQQQQQQGRAGGCC